MSIRILYIFPHPDDESFGPAAAMHGQLRDGHECHLLTLTKGGATKQRHKLGLSVEEMGEVRYREMLDVEKTIGLTSMTVLDFPDSGLKEMDPRQLEDAVAGHIRDLQPDIVVSYPVHGVSGFHDHIIMHSVAKRVFLELRDAGDQYLRRLAFITLPDSGKSVWSEDGSIRMKTSEEELIDCVVQLGPEELATLKNALSCYASYKDTIEKSGVLEKIGDKVFFEIYGEDFTPPLADLTLELPGS